MSGQPNTISDADWAKLQRGAADKYGSLVKNDGQAAATETASAQRDASRWS